MEKCCSCGQQDRHEDYFYCWDCLVREFPHLGRTGEIIKFVRYGNFPESGRSRDHRSGSLESGVSVYEVDQNGEVIYSGFSLPFWDRETHFGTGKIVGWGADGEPLVEVKSIERR